MDGALPPALVALLASLGPWGPFVGAGITLAIYYLRKRLAPQQPDAAPAPAPQPSTTPVLDALMQLLRARIAPPRSAAAMVVPPPDAEAEADISHEQAAAILLQVKPPAK